MIMSQEVKMQLEEAMGKEQVNQALDRQTSVLSHGSADHDEDRVEPEVAQQPNGTAGTAESKAGAKLIEKESAETGKVKMDVYWYYMKNLGLAGSISVLFLQAIYQVGFTFTVHIRFYPCACTHRPPI